MALEYQVVNCTTGEISRVELTPQEEADHVAFQEQIVQETVDLRLKLLGIILED